jgi:hypothetical protein
MALRVPIAVLAVVLLAPAASAQSSTPRGEILRQVTLFKQARWRAMYTTYTPRFRRSCSYARFVRVQRRTRELLGTNFQLRGIRVRMETARRAIIAYEFVRGGQTIARVTFSNRDVYARIGSGWYDDLDRVSAC